MGDRVDDLGRLVDLEQAEVAAAGDVEQDAAGAFDGGLEQRAGDGGAGGVDGPALARRAPMPMMAVPALLMIIFTSAKSVLIRPGVVMRSVMPCTPCRRTSSAILKALTIDVLSLDTVRSRSLGMMMRVSTFSLSFFNTKRP